MLCLTFCICTLAVFDSDKSDKNADWSAVSYFPNRLCCLIFPPVLLSDVLCAWPTRWRWGKRSKRQAVCSVSLLPTIHLPALLVASANLQRLLESQTGQFKASAGGHGGQTWHKHGSHWDLVVNNRIILVLNQEQNQWTKIWSGVCWGSLGL